MESTVDATEKRVAYDERDVYMARVIDQMLARSANGETQLIVTVQLVAKLRNPKNAAEGTVPCPPAELDVRLNFPETEEDRLARTLRELERLGFADDDVSRLHPDHREFVNLAGTEVHVRMHLFGGLEYWNLYWPPSKLGGTEAKVAAESLRGRIAAARKKAKGGGKKGAGDGAPNDQPTSPGGAN
jgi:hypothetical protein